MVLKLVLRDLRKEWSWALFYSIVATMTAMAIVYISSSYSSVQKQFSSIQSFIDKRVFIFESLSTQMESNLGDQPTLNSNDLSDFLQHSLSRDGKAGSYVFIANEGYVKGDYESILVLFGQYSYLAGFDYETSMALFVPAARKEDVGKRVAVGDQEIEVVGTVEPDFDLFHPLYYIDAGNPLLSNTLILCTRDFQTINSLFPWSGLSSEVFGRMVFVNPSDLEMDQMQKAFYDRYGSVYRGVSTQEFVKTTSIASMRAHRLYIWFYLLSGMLFLFLLLCNIIRMIEARVADYTVHHLYGAPIRTIQRRVGGFILALNALPIIGVIYVLRVNEMKLWYLLPLFLALVVAIYGFAAGYAGRRIGTLKGLGHLRRDY